MTSHTFCDVSQCFRQLDGYHVRRLLSMQSITSQCQIANRFWQDTSEKHYSHNNRGERSLCGVVLSKLTRPFTAFDTGLAATAQWKAYKFADVVWKAQMSTLFTTAPELGKRNNWLVHLLSPAKYSSRRTKNRRHSKKMKEHLLQSASDVHLSQKICLFSSCNTHAAVHVLDIH